MDGVEIVMGVEEQFGISIADYEAEKISTPRQLTDLILQKLETTGVQTCRTQRAFYLLRRHLMERGVPRSSIALGSPVSSFITPDQEAEFWRGLQQSLNAPKWPNLELSSQAEAAVTVAALASSGIIFVAVLSFADPTIAFLTSFVALLAVLVVSARFARPFKKRIPKRIQTVRDLALVVGGVIEEGKWHRSEVAYLVKKIIFQVLCPEEVKYHEDAHFVRELGLN